MKRAGLIRIPSSLEAEQSYSSSIGVGDQIEPGELIQIAADYQLSHIVQASNHDHSTEILTSELMLQNPERYLNFPASAILSPEECNEAGEAKVRLLSYRFESGKDKQQLLKEVDDCARKVVRDGQILHHLHFAADELFTNAVYNAPYVKFEKNGPGAPRSAEYGKDPKLADCELFIGHQGKRIVIGCSDPYGSLNPHQLVRKLKNCFENGVHESINQSTGGAGIGTFLIFQFAVSFYAGVSVNHKTVICWTYSLERSFRLRSAIPKNLHLCVFNPFSAKAKEK